MGFPAQTETRTIGEFSLQLVYFADRILVTISKDGGIAKMYAVSAPANLNEATGEAVNPSFSTKPLLGGSDPYSMALASKIASIFYSKSPSESRTIVIGLSRESKDDSDKLNDFNNVLKALTELVS